MTAAPEIPQRRRRVTYDQARDMERRIIDPWTWREEYGFHQGHEVVNATRTLYLSGQTSLDGDGNPVCVGDMAGQIRQVIDNIEAVLKAHWQKIWSTNPLERINRESSADHASGGSSPTRLSPSDSSAPSWPTFTTSCRPPTAVTSQKTP